MTPADVQSARARQYAVCVYALKFDRVSDGAEAIFDQALTNGLAAIVADAWPGEERDQKGRVRSADALLTVVKNRGMPDGPDVVRVVHDPAGPLFDSDSPLGPVPNFTVVQVTMLRDAITKTQAIRHARAGRTATPALTDAHVAALEELDYHPALFAISNELAERVDRATLALDSAEQVRALDYLAQLDDEELARRQEIDYTERYAFQTKDELVEVEECPVCWTTALVARERDHTIDEVGIGYCVVCSYERNAQVAEDMALQIDLDRAIERSD